MAIISDYQEETQTSSSSSSQPKPSKPIPFSSTFDPSNPAAFLENVFDFIAKESTDFFDNDSAEKVVLSAVRAVKVKKAKAVAAEKAKIAAEEKAKVDKAAAAVAAAEKKAKEVVEKEDEKKDGESGLAGINKKFNLISFYFCPSFFFNFLIIIFLKFWDYNWILFAMNIVYVLWFLYFRIVWIHDYNCVWLKFMW